MARSKDRPGGQYRAADLKKASGLSYRQLNDWAGKGVLPDSRTDESEWRKFTPREIFVLMVCKEIRTRFGTPLDSLRWIRSVMLQDGTDHFEMARGLMAHGLSVLLLTDLTETFLMEPDLELEGYARLGFFRQNDAQAYIVLGINSLVNRLTACLKNPVELMVDDRVYDAFQKGRKDRSVNSTEELELMRLIRTGEYVRLTVHLNNGEILRAETEKEHSFESLEKLVQIIDSSSYQTVYLTRVDGRVMRVLQKESLKFKPRGSQQNNPERSPSKQ